MCPLGELGKLVVVNQVKDSHLCKLVRVAAITKRKIPAATIREFVAGCKALVHAGTSHDDEGFTRSFKSWSGNVLTDAAAFEFYVYLAGEANYFDNLTRMANKYLARLRHGGRSVESDQVGSTFSPVTGGSVDIYGNRAILHCNLSVAAAAHFSDAPYQLIHERGGERSGQQTELIGQPQMATGAIGEQAELTFLDPALHLAVGAVHVFAKCSRRLAQDGRRDVERDGAQAGGAVPEDRDHQGRAAG